MKLATTLAALLLSANALAAEPGTSPWGPQDEIGRLNLVTQASSAAILARISGGRAYDLSVEPASAAAAPMTCQWIISSACQAGRQPATRLT